MPIPEEIQRLLETKFNGEVVARRINPETNNPFTENEILDMLKPENRHKLRQLHQGGRVSMVEQP